MRRAMLLFVAHLYRSDRNPVRISASLTAVSLTAVSLVIAWMATACSALPVCHGATCDEDRAITQSVQTTLLNYPSLQSPNRVRVQTINHTVYLYGLVDNEVERSMASDVARSVAGVQQVVNSIGFNYAGP